MKTRANRRPLRDKLLPVMGPLLLVGFWWLAAASGLLNTKLVPAPGPTLTTTLNALSGAIPGEERIVTIEDAAELKLHSASPQVSVCRSAS